MSTAKSLRNAARYGIRRELSALLEQGVDPNIPYKNSYALIEAAHKNDLNSVKMLLEHGADPNIMDQRGQFPLSATENSKIMKVLLKHGADINKRDPNGCTALMMVCKTHMGDDEACLNVLLKHGADPNLQDNKGYTALMHALHYMTYHDFINMALIEYLLGAGADFLNLHNKNGLTAYDMARKTQSDHVSNYFIYLYNRVRAENIKMLSLVNTRKSNQKDTVYLPKELINDISKYFFGRRN